MRSLPAALIAVISVILGACVPLEPNALPAAESANLNDLFLLPEGEVGWAVGDSGTILHTTDGGETWHPQAGPFGQRGQVAAPDLLSVDSLSDGRRGWAAGSDGVILATTDGGKSWNLELNYVGVAFRAVQFLEDAQRGWVVGGDGYILATSDGGQIWQRQASGTRQEGSTPSSSSTTVCAAGPSGWMARSRRPRTEAKAGAFRPDAPEPS